MAYLFWKHFGFSIVVSCLQVESVSGRNLCITILFLKSFSSFFNFTALLPFFRFHIKHENLYFYPYEDISYENGLVCIYKTMSVRRAQSVLLVFTTTTSGVERKTHIKKLKENNS
jgi:hypothetical protein